MRLVGCRAKSDQVGCSVRKSVELSHYHHFCPVDALQRSAYFLRFHDGHDPTGSPVLVEDRAEIRSRGRSVSVTRSNRLGDFIYGAFDMH